jgi:hypothetical protein
VEQESRRVDETGVEILVSGFQAREPDHALALEVKRRDALQDEPVARTSASLEMVRPSRIEALMLSVSSPSVPVIFSLLVRVADRQSKSSVPESWMTFVPPSPSEMPSRRSSATRTKMSSLSAPSRLSRAGEPEGADVPLFRPGRGRCFRITRRGHDRRRPGGLRPA